jgi:hypothetical protein
MTMTGYMQGSIAQAVNQWRNEASEANKQVALWREHALNLERKLESALQEIATLKGNPKPTLAVENLFEEEVPKKVNTSKKKKINESGGMGATSDHTAQVQISEE